MAKALYHTEGNDPKEFEVLKTNPDKTVDLGTNGVLAVGACTVVVEPKIGSCTIQKTK